MSKYIIPTDEQIREHLAHNCENHTEDTCDLTCVSCGQITGVDGYCDDVDCPNYKSGLIAGYLEENCACDVMGFGPADHAHYCPKAPK